MNVNIRAIDGTVETHTLQTLDKNDSYKESFSAQVDLNEDGQFTSDETLYCEYIVETFDDKKNLILSEFYAMEEEEFEEMSTFAAEEGMVQIDGSRITFTYGERDEILAMEREEFDGEGSYDKTIKIVYSDFQDVATGIAKSQVKNQLSYSITKEQLEFSMEQMNAYAIYNASGMMVASKKTSNNNEYLPISTYPKGLYILKVMGNKGTETVKFIKR